MIKKLNNILQPILFSWIILLGIVYAYPDCHYLLSNFCLQSNSLSSTDKVSISTFTYKFHHSTSHGFAAAKEDSCCKKNPCEPEGELFYVSQNSKIQKQSKNFVNADPLPVDKNQKTNLIFDQYKFSQTTSIYILTQSFLC